MNSHAERAALLFEQARYDQAQEQLRLALSADPDDAYAHALLAMCLAESEAFEEASSEANQAVLLEPDYDFAHYAMAMVNYERNRYAEALASIREAIRLFPMAPAHFSLLAALHFDQHRWTEALEAAEQGLKLDAEDVACTNLRAMSLVKLGRRDEAGQAIQGALARRPESAVTHANQGWTLLASGERDKAMEHFREALRLDAEDEWARAGIVEALKSSHFIYALVLRYFLWMAKLTPRAQWGVILGVFFAGRALSALARSSPDLAPWILPVRILLFAAIVLTWTADPLFNLLLRLNRFGRLALSREQAVASNWFGACALAALVSLALCFVFGWNTVFSGSAMFFGFLMVPVAATFKGQPGWPRRALTIWTLGLALAGATWLVLATVGGEEPDADPQLHAAANTSLIIFLVGWVAFLWGANLIIQQRPKR